MSEREGFGMHGSMKVTKLFAVALACGVLLVHPALGEDPHAKCCAEAKKAGKECAHPCCVQAKKDGKVCEKCPPATEEKKPS